MRYLLLPSVFLALATATAAPIPVELVESAPGQWQLLRGGEPFFIMGAGGDGPKDLLAASGGNTFRTWGIGPETGDLLDEAHELGLAVVLGHWLGHERHGFDYGDSTMVAEQFARVKRDVLAHRDHPALLLWGVGNEMEGFAAGDDPRIWAHVQEIAAMIRELDPHHPTLTTTADIGGDRVGSVRDLCPDIAIHGINSYGGLPSIPARYRAAGGTKPILITEFGPPGTWEIGMTSFGAPPELTSTEKAAVYRDAFTQGCLDAGGLCLGGFAFIWGSKIEATATWFGMFLPNGDKLAAVDAMTELWSGRPAADLCPEIRSFGLVGPDVVQAGDTVRVALDIADPEGAPVTVSWKVTGEVPEYNTFGDEAPAPLALAGIISEGTAQGATLVMPSGGIFRIHMTASDGTGGGAVANVPVMVRGETAPIPLELPLAVYADGQPQPWAPSGWMGGHVSLTMDAACPDNPRSGPTCLRFTYDEPGRWVGVAWQDPPNDWGELPGGYDLSGAGKLTFWARGAEGGEKVDFSVGLLTSGKPHHDSLKVEKKGVKLNTGWTRYEIKLKGKDLSRVKTPFVWALAGRGRPVTIYLDDIRFE